MTPPEPYGRKVPATTADTGTVFEENAFRMCNVSPSDTASRFEYLQIETTELPMTPTTHTARATIAGPCPDARVPKYTATTKPVQIKHPTTQ